MARNPQLRLRAAARAIKKTYHKLSELLSKQEPKEPSHSADLRDLLFAIVLTRACEERAISRLPHISSLLPSRGKAIDLKNLAELLTSYNQVFSNLMFLPPSALLKALDEDSAKIMGAFVKGLEKNLSLHELGFLYESFIIEDLHKKEGIFYTPPLVARQICQDALKYTEKKQLKKGKPFFLLDPACGAGHFLLEAWDLLFSQNRTKILPIQSHYQLLCATIFGIDKDPRAVQLSRLLLQLRVLETAPFLERDPLLFREQTPAIFSGNSLFSRDYFDAKDEDDAYLLSEHRPISWKELFPQALSSGGFSCVVGNPPYGLSREEKLSPLENQKLRAIFKRYCSGKLNKYLAFMAQGYQLLAERGVLSYIVPNAWLGIRDGQAMREILLRAGELCEITTYSYPVFRASGVEPISFIVTKGKTHRSLQIHSRARDSKEDKEVVEVPLSYCLSSSEYQIPLQWNSDISELAFHLQRKCKPLESYDGLQVRIALQAYTTGRGTPPQSKEDVKNHIFHSESVRDESSKPYLEGKDITPFQIKWSGSYLQHGPWLAEYHPLQQYQGPRLVLREILAPLPYRIHCAYTAETYLYNKSCLHILPSKATESSEELLQALEAVLNSRLASQIITLFGRKSQRRLFPKMVAADLKDFPLPLDLESHLPTLAKAAWEIRRYLATEKTAAIPDQLADLLEEEVRRAYKLDNAASTRSASASKSANPLLSTLSTMP